MRCVWLLFQEVIQGYIQPQTRQATLRRPKLLCLRCPLPASQLAVHRALAAHLQNSIHTEVQKRVMNTTTPQAASHE